MKDTQGKYYTYEEYRELIKSEQTDEEGNLIYLYATNKDEQYSYIDAAVNHGYNVLIMDDQQLDVAIVSMLEQKLEKSRFTRVDSDIIDRLIAKEDKKEPELETNKKEILSSVFQSQLPVMNKVEFNVEVQSLGENASPIMITQSEYMRRMKEMAKIQQGMSFYGEMPDMFNLVLNADHKLIKNVLADSEGACNTEISPINEKLAELSSRQNELKKSQEGKKQDEIPQAEKDELSDIEKKSSEEKSKKLGILSEYASKNSTIQQLIDLALLQNNMLKGEALTKFVKRSINLI